MLMSNGEIITEFRQAKDPAKQIGILADLNKTTKRAIVDILRANGCSVPGNYGPKKVETPESKAVQPETPERDPLAAAPPVVPIRELMDDVKKAERPMDRVALEDVVDIFLGALEDFREAPEEVNRVDAAKATLAYMAGVADAFKALHGPIIR